MTSLGTFQLQSMRVECRHVPVDEIIALRHAVLRPGLPRQAAEYAVDHDPGTYHFGAFDGTRTLACVTYLTSEWDGKPAWQLRGMATRAEVRRQGVGRQLLDLIEPTLEMFNPEAKLVWCNARVVAVSFYQSLGWTLVSDRFDVPGVGPHYRMAKHLAGHQ